MSGKARRRREARRRARERREERRRFGPPLEEEAAAGRPAEEGPPEKEQRAPVAAEAGRGRTARRRARRGGAPWPRRLRGWVWLLVVPVLAAGIAFVALGIMGGGSSGTSVDGTAPTATPDPRVAGQTPDVSLSLVAGDDGYGLGGGSFFQPGVLRGNAGDVIEIVVANVGSVSHNLRVAGLDNEYETADDFEPQPFVVKRGETGRMLVKIDEPGTYRFRCDFHAAVQKGTLVLE